jgi:hypothetical protein
LLHLLHAVPLPVTIILHVTEVAGSVRAAFRIFRLETSKLAVTFLASTGISAIILGDTTYGTVGYVVRKTNTASIARISRGTLALGVISTRRVISLRRVLGAFLRIASAFGIRVAFASGVTARRSILKDHVHAVASAIADVEIIAVTI